jgi:hypothetical protein
MSSRFQMSLTVFSINRGWVAGDGYRPVCLHVHREHSFNYPPMQCKHAAAGFTRLMLTSFVRIEHLRYRAFECII